MPRIYLHDIRVLPTCCSHISAALFSPVGGKVGYTGFGNGGENLFVVDISDFASTQLTNASTMISTNGSEEESAYFHPTFTSDGEAIVCLRLKPPPPFAPEHWHICRVDTISGKLSVIVEGGCELDPSCQPNGNSVVFTSFRDGSQEIYSVLVNGSSLQRLTRSEEGSVGWSSFARSNGSAIYSSNGNYIAYLSSVVELDNKVRYEVNLMRYDGSDKRHIAISSNELGRPIWDSVGTKIGFISKTFVSDEMYKIAICVFDINNTSLDVIQVYFENHDEFTKLICFSVNSEYMIVQRSRSDHSMINRSIVTSIYLIHLESGIVSSSLLDTNFRDQAGHGLSPEGSHFLFQANRDGKMQLFVAELKVEN